MANDDAVSQRRLLHSCRRRQLSLYTPNKTVPVSACLISSLTSLSPPAPHRAS